MKIKFYSDDYYLDHVFEKDGKYYSQIFLDYCLYEKDED